MLCFVSRRLLTLIGPLFCALAFFFFLSFLFSQHSNNNNNNNDNSINKNMNFLGFLIGLLVIVAAAFSFVAKKLGSLRDPLQIWDALNNVGLLPIRLRAWIFSTVVGFANPYSKSINFRITELRKGKACGVMKVKVLGKKNGDPRSIREEQNKRKSIFTGGLVSLY